MSDLGAPLDLLAHWQYRQYALAKDIADNEAAIEKFARTRTFTGDPLQGDVDEIKMDLVTLKYLLAEANYWCIRLDLDARYKVSTYTAERVEEYLDRVSIIGQQKLYSAFDSGGKVVRAIEPVDIGRYDRVLVMVGDDAVFDSARPDGDRIVDSGWVLDWCVKREDDNSRALRVRMVPE